MEDIDSQQLPGPQAEVAAQTGGAQRWNQPTDELSIEKRRFEAER